MALWGHIAPQVHIACYDGGAGLHHMLTRMRV